MIQKLVIFGDSISTQQIGEGGYQAPLQMQFPSVDILNFAVAESGASRRTPNNVLSVLDRHAAECTDADAVIVWHGTNDWYWGSPIGETESRDPDTYLGAMRLASEAIRRFAPSCGLIFATPLFRFQAPDGIAQEGDARAVPNKVGYTMLDYEQAVRRAAVLLDARLAETGHLSGFCFDTLEQFQPDHVHPNAAGCKRLAAIFADLLRTL